MGKHTDQRDRTLSVARILYEETDERHPMPLADLVARLDRYGVAAERKSIYRDLAALRKHGLDVVFRAGSEGGWYLASRTFTQPELRAIWDAVAVYRWLPEDQRAEILEKLAGLAPAHQRKSLHRPVALRRRSAREPEEIRGVLDRVHAAIQGQRALSFVPYCYDRGKTWGPSGPRRVVSPKGLLWSGEGTTCWPGTTGSTPCGCSGWIGWGRCWSPACPPRVRRPTPGCGPPPPSAWTPPAGSGCACAAARTWPGRCWTGSAGT